MRVLLTGSTGFVGAALARRLMQGSGYQLRLLVRHPSAEARVPEVVGDLLATTDWSDAMADVEVVLHCAARAHVLREFEADPLAAFRAVNVQGTLRLARAAAAAGVRRFVYVSSVKVHGETSGPGRPFAADDPLLPADAYAVSKAEAELALRTLAAETGMELVIVRPPLVYGPGVKANFLTMMRWLERGVPLPLGAVNNRRSLVGLDNLVDLLVHCIDCPGAANQAFLVSDGEDLSTTQLLRRLARALGRPARLLPLPWGWVEFVATLLGRAEVAQRLGGSLQVDIEKTRQLLDWTPPMSVDEALRKTATAFLRRP